MYISREKRIRGSTELRSRFLLDRWKPHRGLERKNSVNFCFAGGKLSVIPQNNKPRPVGQKNILYKIMTSVLGRTNDRALVDLSGPAHLSGKPSGVLAAAIMARLCSVCGRRQSGKHQMHPDYRCESCFSISE